ncbi:MAG TPA: efflux RND transporter periplasmic adaptor subunit [Steroidobacteraceae bacterium]|nr:efflux RND transporter periplasmic adaptor subunit [Steroidobacteraceae bacterium]
MDCEHYRLPFIIVFLLGLLGLGCREADAQTQQRPPAPVIVAKARQQSFATTITATGTVASRNDARLATEVAGRLEWMAEPGTAVKRGDTVARLDDERLKLELRDNQAAVRRLEANVQLLQTQSERLETLAPENIVSRNQLDEASSRLAMAQQELEQARVAHDRALLDLQRASVRAPFDGYVAERLAQAGEFVALGTPLARLVDTRSVEVVARAPVSSAATLRSGQTVRVRDDQRSVESRIRSVVPVGDERSRLLEIRVALDAGAWPIGSPVRVELAGSAARRVVTVPRDAVILRQGAAYVFRVNAQNKAERVAVQVGAGRDTDVQVSGEIHEGDRIVIRGGERLQPGQSVAVQVGDTRVANQRGVGTPS